MRSSRMPLPLALLLNFGTESLEWKRIVSRHTNTLSANQV